ncbi:MAG TPA: hypothetical protein VLQ91_23180, partial [Draconibacterium sp.]|nr:hypothetical protein [Draconibacterium sp.]
KGTVLFEMFDLGKSNSRKVQLSVNKLLPFLQIENAVKYKYQHSNTKENPVFGDDSLPDDLVHQRNFAIKNFDI